METSLALLQPSSRTTCTVRPDSDNKRPLACAALPAGMCRPAGRIGGNNPVFTDSPYGVYQVWPTSRPHESSRVVLTTIPPIYRPFSSTSSFFRSHRASRCQYGRQPDDWARMLTQGRH
ncbi:uncharacterized protein CIMG_13502 [Coccidioides immitis RS]|uniref:Uncharacterized protein n=1 Tax=Coccidioides immitis (strain RS) TaxID=246410 RepID=A0A0D8JVT2_COCIM|nr:uncharacterized protein CIMG_13502 [Coccidioides immitis RS]KJF61214.1 hypothetical protein CIMG_13502 [Coccidioides immitis RS]